MVAKFLVRVLIFAATVGVGFGAGSAHADVSGFGGNGSGWTLAHGSGPDLPTIASDVLTLTNGGLGDASSAFFNRPQNVSGFTASFIYQATSPGGIGFADGVAFVMQNSLSGAGAVGGNGSGLGYSGISPSAAVELDIFGTSGTNYATGGATGSYLNPSPVDLRSTHPIFVSLDYDGKTLKEVLRDTVNGNTFHTSFAVSIVSDAGGSTAFIGFTGGTGSGTSVQTISDFTFTNPLAAPLISPAMLLFLAVALSALGCRMIARQAR